MKIFLSPQRSEALLVVKKSGEKLSINGEVIDFSSVVEGEIDDEWVPPSPFLVSQPRRVSGDLQISLVLPYGVDASDAAKFPDPLINPPNGILKLPI